MIDEERMKSLEHAFKKVNPHEESKKWISLKTEHVKRLEKEIENLMKQKAQLQDQIDQMEKR